MDRRGPLAVAGRTVAVPTSCAGSKEQIDPAESDEPHDVVQFKRDLIESFQFDGLADVLWGVQDLWRYATHRWLTYRTPTRPRSERWPRRGHLEGGAGDRDRVPHDRPGAAAPNGAEPGSGRGG